MELLQHGFPGGIVGASSAGVEVLPHDRKERMSTRYARHVAGEDKLPPTTGTCRGTGLPLSRTHFVRDCLTTLVRTCPHSVLKTGHVQARVDAIRAKDTVGLGCTRMFDESNRSWLECAHFRLTTIS